MIKRKIDEFDVSTAAKTVYSKEEMAGKYMNLYRSMVGNE
jgi:hypothetical protein